MVHVRWVVCPLFGLALLALSSCGGSGVGVRGEVTYEGQPVEKGSITFLPTDGKGQPAGAAITNGRYSLDAITPGPKVVQIEASKKQVFPLNREEVPRNTAATRGRSARGSESARLIPPNAEGNNSKVEVAARRQILDFHLTKPASNQR
jgi:hypothetical protein